ncbi:class I SAM-dependent methyltransferase, partial [Pelagibacteraceae bacterium]|nr:class I SAM-dependent methyltransferase [Pelagibacteraceae bacterium]
NKILKKYSYLFKGDIINVSASSDSDKNCSFVNYYFGNYDAGARYKDYFKNAASYTISNYPNDTTNIKLDKTNMIFLDLEEKLPNNLINKFDVVYSHTVFEHIFDIFKAFENLCMLSKDIVIFVVPQFQRIHDYHRGYKDYWRFTPFAVDELFKRNNLTVLYRETTTGFSESMYLFYIASKNPDKWKKYFPTLKVLEDYINKNNDGLNYTFFSKYILHMEYTIRKIGEIIKKIIY